MQIAALGDSLTDEYSFGNPEQPDTTTKLAFTPPSAIYLAGRSSARNWPLILGALRADQVSFGDYSTTTRGAPRQQGFTQDWALNGAAVGTSSFDLADETLARQLFGNATSPGFLTQSTATTGTNPSDIDAVTIMIGTNNYLQGLLGYLESGGSSNAFLPLAGSTLTPVNAIVEAGIGQAVAAIRAATPATKIVLITTPDITQTTFVQTLLAPTRTQYPTIEAQLRASLATLTSDMTRFAQQYGVELVNIDQVIQTLRQRPQIGDLAVNFAGAGADPSDAFVGDGFHFGTPIQAALAQAIVGAIDRAHGSEVIAPLTDAELGAYAHLTTPAVALVGSTTTLNSAVTTLTATVVNSPGATFPPTGTVTFATYLASDDTTPAHLGSILGQLDLSGGNPATLAIPTSALAAGPVVAVYNGDLQHTRQFSALLTSAQVVTQPTPVMPPGLVTPVPAPGTDPVTTPAPGTISGSPLDPNAPTVPMTPAATVVVTPTYGRNRSGSSVTVTVTVASVGLVPDPLPGGTVTLLVGGRRFKFVGVVAGRAVITVPLARLRGRVVSATYSGDGTLPAASSSAVRIAMNPTLSAEHSLKAAHPVKSTASSKSTTHRR